IGESAADLLRRLLEELRDERSVPAGLGLLDQPVQGAQPIRLICDRNLVDLGLEPLARLLEELAQLLREVAALGLRRVVAGDLLPAELVCRLLLEKKQNLARRRDGR